MHVLPQLRKLEEKYRDSLVVIGVHSAKFDAEKATQNIKEAVARYDVRHPVVNDVEFKIWQGYGVRAWPTLMFIDPEGKVIGRHEGEFPLDGLDRVFQQMISEFEGRGILKRDLLPFQEMAIEEARRPLAFPGKIEFDSRRLFIADSNHHRVIVASTDGEVSEVIGSGESGAADGGFDGPVFDNPQGMAVDGETLYVADAGSHTIKRVDLRERTVRTIAGTGQQSLYRHTGGEAKAYPLNSPYDLSLRDGVLYIAMAGFHQLWSLDLAAETIVPFAGDGGEALKDGPRMEAKLAQPYGVAAQNGNVFFADSETSSLRVAKIGESGRVVTLVGMGLFDFGDRDGVGKDAMLQHVQGVAAGTDVVYIADTYNHRIKQMSLATLRVSVVAGSGKAGAVDGPLKAASFNEPAGLAYGDGKLYVADTNNHAVRVIHLKAGEVSTLKLRGL
jgi:thiol-disulfide isomerase/thioredoxin